MPTPHALPVDGAQHHLVASIIIRAYKQSILLQHLHQCALAPGHRLPGAALVFTHQVIRGRRHQIRAGAVEAANQHLAGRYVGRSRVELVQHGPATRYEAAYRLQEH